MQCRSLTRAEVRDVDRRAIDEYGMSGLVLMENAARGCVDHLMQLGSRGPVVICCGRGNNAGDGFVMARHLELRGITVRLLLLAAAADLRGDAAINFRIAELAGLTILDHSGPFHADGFRSDLAGAEWIVDALLGTGSVGAPRPPLDQAIRVMNSQPCRRLAIDIPSGLDCDTGQPSDPTFRADHTATFVASKVGFGNPAAQPFLGEVQVIDIGVPRKLLAAMFL